VETGQGIRRIEDDGPASVVFTEATVTSAGGKSHSTWVDVFRFDGSLIAEHVSLQSGYHRPASLGDTVLEGTRSSGPENSETDRKSPRRKSVARVAGDESGAKSPPASGRCV
jgi:hypothetical protein